MFIVTELVFGRAVMWRKCRPQTANGHYQCPTYVADPKGQLSLFSMILWGWWINPLMGQLSTAVKTGGNIVQCAQKERQDSHRGRTFSFILCNSKDEISIFKLCSWRGGLSLSVSLVVFISFQFTIGLVRKLNSNEPGPAHPWWRLSTFLIMTSWKPAAHF